MRSLAGWLGLFGWAASLVLSCDGSAGQLFSNEARLGPGGVGGFSGFPSRGGRGGAVGFAGRGGRGGAGGVAEEPDGGAGDVPGKAGNGGAGEGGAGEGDGVCTDDAECEDRNDCTLDRCEAGICTHAPFGAGAECGSDAEDSCSAPDTCDGAGVCSANDAPDDTACEGGSCRGGECISGDGTPSIPGNGEGCPAEVVAALPFQASWRTVGGVNLYDASCDAANTPDFAVVFTAPATGIYRFEAAGVVGDNDPETPGSEASVLADSVLVVVVGACTGSSARELGCNDDAQPNVVRDSRVDVALIAGATVTVYTGEYSEIVPGGGSGTLSIRQLSN